LVRMRVSLSPTRVETLATRVYVLSDAKAAKEFFTLCCLALQCARGKWSYEFVANDYEAPPLSIEAVVAVGEETAVLRTTSPAAIYKVVLSADVSARVRSDWDSRNEYQELFVDDDARKYLLSAGYTKLYGHYPALKFNDRGERSVQSIVDGDELVGLDLIKVAKEVQRDVSAALEIFHKNRLTFVDLHPGNMVKGSDGVVKLIDWECLCKVGTVIDNTPAGQQRSSLSSKRIMFRRGFIPPAYHAVGAVTSAEGDNTSLVLVLAWIVDFLEFRSNISATASGVSGAAHFEWRNQCSRVCNEKATLMSKLR